MAYTVSHIYCEYAVDLAERFKGGTFLKTDLCNECMTDRPDVGGIAIPLSIYGKVHAVEYQPGLVDQARMILPESISCHQGDIRKLEFANNTFDCVFDFSTIDHIRPQDVHTVIHEYARVLKHKGEAIIVSWIDPNFIFEEMDHWLHTNQYYHSEVRLVELMLGAGLNVLEKKIIVTQNDKILMKFHVRKERQ